MLGGTRYTTVNAIIRNCLILGLLVVVGCATHRQSRFVGRWKVSGTDDVLRLMKDHSARLTSGGKTITGSYQGLAPDLLKLTFPAIAPQSEERTITYHVPLDGRVGRSLTVFTDTESKMSPTTK